MRILITGASRGLGQSIANQLAAPGNSLALCASGMSADMETTAAQCRERGATVLCPAGDLAQFEVPARLVGEAVAAFGGLDAVVSNAGIVHAGPLGSSDQTAWDQVFNINVRSAWQLAQEWAADGVRINTVLPGLLRTTLTEAIYADPQKKATREALVPMHRIGDPQRDCAGVVQFLLSADSAYMSGQNLVVDGALLGSIRGHLADRPDSERAT